MNRLKTHLVILSIVGAAILFSTHPPSRNWLRSWYIKPQVVLDVSKSSQSFQSVINLPWLHYGQDFGKTANWSWAGVSRQKDTLTHYFQMLSKNKVESITWFLFCDGRSSPEFDSTGYTKGLDAAFWQDYDAAVRMARKYKIAIVWVLLDYLWLFPEKQQDGAQLSGHADILSDPAKRAVFFQNVLTPLLKRYPLEPQIAGWILINEPENALKDGLISLKALKTFVKEAAILVKKHTYHQPVSVASSDLPSLLRYWYPEAPHLDFLLFHHYAPFLPPPLFHIQHHLPDAPRRPVYIGEFNWKAPPIAVDSLVSWSNRFGFSGVWPWSIRDPQYFPGNQAIASFRKAIAKIRSLPHPSSLPDAERQLQQVSAWWHHHQKQVVLPIMQTQRREWQTAARHHAGEYQKNRNWEKMLQSRLDSLHIHNQHKQEELREAYQCLYDNRNRLTAVQQSILAHQHTIREAQNGVQRCEAWIDSVKTHLQQNEKKRQSQSNHLDNAWRRIALHQSLYNFYHTQLQWTQALYIDFPNSPSDPYLQRKPAQ